jgi:hypothetical protein
MTAPKSAIRGKPAGSFGSKRLDEMTEREAKHALFSGVSLSDLEVLFRMDRRTITARVPWAEIKPAAVNGTRKLYFIRDVAPYLVKPAGSIEDHIKRMRPNDLPALLQKEFWNGRRAKQRFLEDEKELFRADAVVGMLSTAFKTIRTQLLLMPDAVERRTGLSDKQREDLRNEVDKTLASLQSALVAALSESRPGWEPGMNDDNGDDRPQEPYDDTFDTDDDTFDVGAEDYGGL